MTVIVSSSVPTFMSALIVATKLEGSSTPSRRIGGESRECEGDFVDARPEIDDGVAALFVGDGGFGFLDQHRACGFNSDARQDGTRFVPDLTRELTLSMHEYGQQ